MVNWDGIREDSLYCCKELAMVWGVFNLEDKPSSMPRPDRRIGTREIELGETT